MFLADYHSHSICSPDGHASLAEMAQAALEAGLSELCVTDHCDLLGLHGEAVTSFDWAPLDAQFARTQPLFAQTLSLKLGLELGEAWEDPALAAQIVDHPGLDFVLGSVHNLSAVAQGLDLGLIHYESEEQCHDILDRYLGAMEALVELPCFDILSHVVYPLRYMGRDGFRLTFQPYESRLRRIFTRLAASGRGIEFNTHRGNDIEIWRWVLTLYKDCGGSVITLGSDAHYPQHVAAGFPQALSLLRECGFPHIATFDKHTPILHPLS